MSRDDWSGKVYVWAVLDFDRDAPLTELLAVSRNPALASMSVEELTELAVHCRERHVGKVKDADRVKRLEAKARKDLKSH